MGTREYLLDKAKKEGLDKGIQAGMASGILKGKIEMLQELGFSVADICSKLSLTKTELENALKGV